VPQPVRIAVVQNLHLKGIVQYIHTQLKSAAAVTEQVEYTDLSTGGENLPIKCQLARTATVQVKLALTERVIMRLLIYEVGK
jgi:hypothetical protein